MTKQEYTTWNGFARETKELIYNHLLSIAIIRPDFDKVKSNKTMEQFHNEICVNNQIFPNDANLHETYASFFKWLKNAEHDENLFHIFGHTRAFKNFIMQRNQPNRYKPTVDDVIVGKIDVEPKDLRILNIPSNKLKQTIQTMEHMDNQVYEDGSIGQKLSRGKKWTEFKFYQNAKYTLQQRGEL